MWIRAALLLLVALVLGVVQLALGLHVRATLADAAAEGARHASLVGSDASAGVTRTRELISTALGPGYAERVTAGTATVAGLAHTLKGSARGVGAWRVAAAAESAEAAAGHDRATIDAALAVLSQHVVEAEKFIADLLRTY